MYIEVPRMAAQDAQRGMERTGDRATVAATTDEAGQRPKAAAGLDPRPFIALAGLGGFAVLTWLIVQKTNLPFDQQLLEAAKGLGQYMPEWRGLSDSANLPLIAVGAGIVIWLLWTKQRAEAVLVIVILALVTAGSEVVKLLVARPRPPGFDNTYLGAVYSFPSGHVLEAVTIYGIIAVLVWRSSLPRIIRVLVPLIFIAIVALVAVARVAVGEHYPSDVLAGLLAGIGFVALFSWLTDILAARRAGAQR
jgi:membrane-associated phospholipid phosphatase